MVIWRKLNKRKATNSVAEKCIMMALALAKKLDNIIVANGFEDVALRMAQMVGDGKLGGVAFESERLFIKSKFI